MQEFIEVYNQNREDIESFVINTLKNGGDILGDGGEEGYGHIFQAFPSVELIYITDKDYNQITPNIYRNRIEKPEMGKSRSYMSEKMHQRAENFYISSPYISTATGKTCITIMKQEGNSYVFIDFRLSTLLGRLGLVELHPSFNNLTKVFYKSAGFSLMFFAFLSIIYALSSYGYHIFVESDFTLDSLFKPIVALTLGLAIFDLSKTILEREVFFKNYSKGDEDTKVLSKFAVAIVIALSIEALMVVFKIALHDYTQMIHALYLIAGVGIIMVALALFHYFTKKVG